MKFRSRYTEMKPTFSNKGNPIKDVFELKIDEKGRKKIEKVGETDLQAAIDAEAPSVDLDMILARFAAGDATALERAKGFYADISELPVKLQDVMNMNYEAEKFFMSLPADVRSVFGNNYMEFIYNPEKLVDLLNKEEVKVDDSVNEDVVKDDDQEQ